MRAGAADESLWQCNHAGWRRGGVRGNLGWMKNEKITDAEFEVITYAEGKPLPWWRRVYVNWWPVLVIVGIAIAGAMRAFSAG